MTLKLQLSPDVEARLRDRATLMGRSPETLALEALEEKLATSAEPDDALSPGVRLAEFGEWFASHPASKATALDDGRESIYDGCGQ